MSACWHCNGTNRCNCAVCSGPCGFCAGRRRTDELRPKLEAAGIDPRESRHWVFKRGLTESHRVFDPFGEIRAAWVQEWERARQSKRKVEQ